MSEMRTRDSTALQTQSKRRSRYILPAGYSWRSWGRHYQRLMCQ